ncbi:MAG: hypothetical protein LBK95_09855 [Bifidobacteriaceae bacterium]|jgi:hypothetical protein|nr:hypothetical protein [Bifidobacteriaceae bacterium]
MARRYRRKTDRVPQEERRLTVRTVANDPVDMERLVDMFLMHAFGAAARCGEDSGEVEFLRRHLPGQSGAPDLLRAELR